jgi:hypothetical protein
MIYHSIFPTKLRYPVFSINFAIMWFTSRHAKLFAFLSIQGIALAVAVAPSDNVQPLPTAEKMAVGISAMVTHQELEARMQPSSDEIQPAKRETALSSDQSEALDLINAARADVGAEPLDWNTGLQFRAHSWAVYLTGLQELLTSPNSQRPREGEIVASLW